MGPPLGRAPQGLPLAGLARRPRRGRPGGLPLDAVLRLRRLHRLRHRARRRLGHAARRRQPGHRPGPHQRRRGARHAPAHPHRRGRWSREGPHPLHQEGKVRFTSHRDVARMWERALRRVAAAGRLPEGFSPRPKLHFGLALSTGHESLAEYLDVDLDADDVGHRRRRRCPRSLTPALPVGLDVTAVGRHPTGTPSLQQAVTSCSWRIEVRGVDPADARRGVDRALGGRRRWCSPGSARARTSPTTSAPTCSISPSPARPTPAPRSSPQLATQPRGLRSAELLAVLGDGLVEGRGAAGPTNGRCSTAPGTSRSRLLLTRRRRRTPRGVRHEKGSSHDRYRRSPRGPPRAGAHATNALSRRSLNDAGAASTTTAEPAATAGPIHDGTAGGDGDARRPADAGGGRGTRRDRDRTGSRRRLVRRRPPTPTASTAGPSDAAPTARRSRRGDGASGTEAVAAAARRHRPSASPSGQDDRHRSCPTGTARTSRRPRPPRGTRPQAPDRRHPPGAAGHRRAASRRTARRQGATAAAAAASASAEAGRGLRRSGRRRRRRHRRRRRVAGEAKDGGRRRRRRGGRGRGGAKGTAHRSPRSPTTPVELDEATLEQRRGRERKGRPVGRYLMAVHVQAEGHPDRRARGALADRALRVAPGRRHQPDPRQHLPGQGPERAARHGGGVRRHRHAEERRALPGRHPVRPRGHRREGRRTPDRADPQGPPDHPLPGHQEPDRRQGRPAHPGGVAAGPLRRAHPEQHDLRHLQAPARRRAQAPPRASSTRCGPRATASSCAPPPRA